VGRVDGAVEATLAGEVVGIATDAVAGAATGSDVAGPDVSDGLAIRGAPAIAIVAHAQANSSFIAKMLAASPE
jgi:hypothetical protein